MIVKVQISKTWQEKQYEPFNISLGVERDFPTDCIDLEGGMEKEADRLQQIAQKIYEDRCARERRR